MSPTSDTVRRVPRHLLALIGVVSLVGAALAQAPGRPYPVKIEAEKTEVAEVVTAVDPTPHIVYQFGHNQNFGLVVDGNRITYSPQGSTNNILTSIDGQLIAFGVGPGRWDPLNVKLPPGPFGKVRHGNRSTWVINNLHISQILEIVPSRIAKGAVGQKRRLDTVLVRYVVENKDEQPHKVGIRSMIDMLIVNNDGALFASPTTHPGQVLNGVEVRDKGVPEYLQVLQMPNLQNPGFVAHFTFKLGNRLIGPDRVVMTGLGAGGGGWDIPAMQSFDTAIGIFFSPREVKGKSKMEFAYAYGHNIASNPENEGKVTLALGGSFAPHKLFTVTAVVDEPIESQTLTLDLPAGMECVEGKAIQPVPPPVGQGSSIVMWKARVLQPGTFPLRVRSSNGVTHTRTITVGQPENGAGEK